MGQSILWPAWLLLGDRSRRCVGPSALQVKDVADYVTASNDDDGECRLLQQCLLNAIMPLNECLLMPLNAFSSCSLPWLLSPCLSAVHCLPLQQRQTCWVLPAGVALAIERFLL